MLKIITAVFIGLFGASVAQARPATKPADPEVRTETLDARIAKGRLVALSGSQVTLKTETGEKKIPLADISEMTQAKPGDPMSRLGQAVIASPGGRKVTASRLSVADGKVKFTNSSLGEMSFAFSSFTAIYLPDSSRTAAKIAAKCAEMELEPDDQDLVVVARKTGGLLGVKGILKSVDDKSLTFSWKGEDRMISLQTVRAIFLAPTNSSKPAKFKGVLTLRDGSGVGFASVKYAGGVFGVSIDGSSVLKMPAGKMASIKFSSDRVMSLSDLKPQSVKQHGLLDTTMGWRIDRSVGGGPITMGRRVYSRGLGLHSFCELTYSLGGQYRALIATVGIDDVVRPGGDAELTFIGDGKKLLAPLRITGKGKPQAVRIPLAGVKSLVIRVDYGKDRLDVGDHVDFAGARLIK
jgi:hypothetical protein